MKIHLRSLLRDSLWTINIVTILCTKEYFNFFFTWSVKCVRVYVFSFLLVLVAGFIVITYKSHWELEQIAADWWKQNNRTIPSHFQHNDFSTDLFGESIFITLIMSE